MSSPAPGDAHVRIWCAKCENEGTVAECEICKMRYCIECWCGHGHDRCTFYCFGIPVPPIFRDEDDTLALRTGGADVDVLSTERAGSPRPPGSASDVGTLLDDQSFFGWELINGEQLE